MGIFDFDKKEDDIGVPVQSGPPAFDQAKMVKDMQDAKDKKGWLEVIGTMAGGLQSTPSSYEMLYGGKVNRPDIKGMLDSAAKNIEDPSERQMKLYSAYKSANDAKKSDTQVAQADVDLSNSRIGQSESEKSRDPNSDRNKAFRSTLMATAPQIVKAMGPNFDSLIEADKPSMWDAVKLREQIDSRKQDNALKYGQKKDETVDKLAKQFKDDMDADKGRAGNFGLISGKVQSADRLQTLMNAYKNGDLPKAQMEELALGMSNMLAGSSGSSRAQTEALVPHTLWGSAQDAGSWLMNEPRGAGQQKFVEKMADTIQREKETANQQLNQIRANRLGAHNRFKQLAPDQYTQMLTQYGIDPNGKPGQSPVIGGDKQLSGPMIDSADAAPVDPQVQAYADQHNLSTDVAYRILKNRGAVK